jgi:S1-C subfamily serine protease
MRTIRRGILVAVVVALAAAAGVTGKAIFGDGSASAASPGSTSRGIVVINTNLDYQGAAAAGTGMVIGSGGLILTNNHVIRGATTIHVVDTRTRRTYTASVLGYDIAADVAVLRVANPSGLATAALGSSSNLHRGQSVTAVGNAGGTGVLVSSSGAITGLGSAITVRDDSGDTARLTGLIRTNASLQPGDSGGPLFDRSAHVIGMDAAASVGFSFQSAPGRSQSFAIPINTALTLARQIEAGKSSAAVHIGQTAFLGVSVQGGDGGAFGDTGPAGATVADVVPGGPAEQAGLQPGDVITAVNGQTISSPEGLVPVLQRTKPGDTVTLTWTDQFGNESSGQAHLVAGPPQ